MLCGKTGCTHTWITVDVTHKPCQSTFCNDKSKVKNLWDILITQQYPCYKKDCDFTNLSLEAISNNKKSPKTNVHSLKEIKWILLYTNRQRPQSKSCIKSRIITHYKQTLTQKLRFNYLNFLIITLYIEIILELHFHTQQRQTKEVFWTIEN